MSKIYLAGPIHGLSYEEARNGWRAKFPEKLASGIECFSPMRGKDFLKDEKVLNSAPNTYEATVMASAKGILGRDHFDVNTCDLMVANFTGAVKASIGTCVEFGWAYAYKKPVIMIIEEDAKDKNPHFHAFLTEIATYVVNTPDQAANLANKLLVAGV